MKYNVCFTQYWDYVVEAENEDEAFDLAHEEFRADMCSPIASTYYDDVEIKEADHS